MIVITITTIIIIIYIYIYYIHTPFFKTHDISASERSIGPWQKLLFVQLLAAARAMGSLAMAT